MLSLAAIVVSSPRGAAARHEKRAGESANLSRLLRLKQQEQTACNSNGEQGGSGDGDLDVELAVR